MKKLPSLFVAAAATFLAVSAHADPINLIKNGGFEGPVLNSLGVLSTTAAPTDWTVTTGYGVQIRNTSTGSYLPPASEGSQYYYIGDGGQHADIQQQVSLISGNSYLLNFDLSPLLGLDWVARNFNAEVDLTITNGLETFLPGLTYDYFVPSRAQRWMTETYAFTAGYTGDYSFIFTTLGANGGTSDAAFIDNVRLTDITPNRVPEAYSTLVLLSASLLGLILISRHLTVNDQATCQRQY